MLAEIRCVDISASLSVQCHCKLVEGAVFHVYDIVNIAHIVDEVCVAVGDEVEPFEVGELL